jgi:hypothetical protein
MSGVVVPRNSHQRQSTWIVRFRRTRLCHRRNPRSKQSALEFQFQGVYAVKNGLEDLVTTNPRKSHEGGVMFNCTPPLSRTCILLIAQ